MKIREKTNAEFRNEVNEILARSESCFDQPYFNNRSHYHLKLSFPKFNGEDPTGWVYKAEQYFDFKSIAVDQQLASFYLEGIALQWHRWFTKFKGPLTWDEFTQAVLQRFGPTYFKDPSEALTRFKQTTMVTAYQETFEKLSHRVGSLNDKVCLDIKIKQPSTLADTIGVARLISFKHALVSFCKAFK
ncbi:hypothetical protein ACOSP7_021471 [Xanthoceras sorbifolium]